MAKTTRSRRHCARHLRPSPYPSPFYIGKACKGAKAPKAVLAPQKQRDWKDATCSVCMEYPHNAVLLLCSSHEKGCRPYMCGTSYRHSNCLDQFKKAYIKEAALNEATTDKPEASELVCPLCRGQVKGWTVVEPAREYLNSKKRTCMHDGCSFLGNYKELRKHVKLEHPFAKPREVDPVMEQKWRSMEREQERQDVISTIRSSMPRALVFGDYVIDFDSDEDADDGVQGEGPGIGQSLVYFLMREGARIMTLRSDSSASETGEDDHRRHSSNAGSFLFDGDDDDQPFIVRPGDLASRVPERQRRRRRRSRSGGRGISGAS